jgi:hypothetical protein
MPPMASADRYRIQVYKLSAVPHEGGFWELVAVVVAVAIATVQIRSGMLREPAAED